MARRRNGRPADQARRKSRNEPRYEGHSHQRDDATGGEDAARYFYGELLGLREIPKPQPLKSRGGVWFDGDGLDIHCSIEEHRLTPDLLRHFGLECSDVEVLRRRLIDAGIATEDGHGGRRGSDSSSAILSATESKFTKSAAQEVELSPRSACTRYNAPMSEVSVRYISRHLLTTIDLNWVVARIIAEFPDLTRLVIEQMHDEEQKTAAPRDEDGIVNVRERIHIYVGKNCEQRRRDLEKEAERHSP